MTTNQLELALIKYFGIRRNFIIPNVYWGLGFLYELDLLVVKTSSYAYEIEIKNSLSDLKAESKKRYFAHCDNRIRKFYFAIPLMLLEKAKNLIPERAGIFTIDEFDRVILYKKAIINKTAKKLTDKELIKLGKLASMRMWKLKKYINQKI